MRMLAYYTPPSDPFQLFTAFARGVAFGVISVLLLVWIASD